ncbi:MAG: LysR family transcriptional regulator [Inquilinaceae bacterium]
MNWNDLRYVLAIGRHQRLAGAARVLGVDDTTVSRRLGAIQIAMGQRLYQRLADGRLELTEAGRAAAAIAERMEADIDRLDRGHADGHTVSGVVRLTSVPVIINRVLAPAVGGLLDRYADLRVEMISDGRDLSLARRETDMALRLARPKVGGMGVKAWRVGRLRFAPYAAATHPERDASSLPWITYDESMAHLPQALWMQTAIKRKAGIAAALKITDVEAAWEAVASGYGRSMLPCLIAGGDARLRELPSAKGAADPVREIWLLVHAELIALPRIRAVAKWIETLMPSGPDDGASREDQAIATAITPS